MTRESRKYFLYFYILLSNLIVTFALNVVPSKKLSSGYEMPIVGLGTYNINLDVIDNAVTSALNFGYRHFDTAWTYKNDQEIGKTFEKWIDNGGKREDLFITTKLPEFANRASDVKRMINRQLSNLGLDYVDLYLAHKPFAFKSDANLTGPLYHEDGSIVIDFDNDIVAVWKEMEKLVKSGLVRSIGLSNFNISQITRIMKHAEIMPSVLQVETHAYHQQKEIREFCKKHNIAVTGQSPLGGHRDSHQSPHYLALPKLLEHPIVVKIARKYAKSSAQILLKYLLQNDIIVIPKSKNSSRIKENIDIFDFELTKDDITKIKSMDAGAKGRYMNYFFITGIEKHPEYPFKDQLELYEKLN